MIESMKSIEFNTWTTLIAMTRGIVCQEPFNKYVNVASSNILPGYPRDLAKFKKPSIIIQKVASDISNTCFDNGYIGQAFDADINTYYDINSRYHEIIFQYDIFADTNMQNSLIESAIIDEILNKNKNIIIYDYITDIDNPQQIGISKLINDVDIIQMGSNENYDYRTAIRFYLGIIQTIVLQQEFVDISKWIKINKIVNI